VSAFATPVTTTPGEFPLASPTWLATTPRGAAVNAIARLLPTPGELALTRPAAHQMTALGVAVVQP
jgi:hypothetical protein